MASCVVGRPSCTATWLHVASAALVTHDPSPRPVHAGRARGHAPGRVSSSWSPHAAGKAVPRRRPITLDTACFPERRVRLGDRRVPGGDVAAAARGRLHRAERKYGINARFLLAAALHESGWGSGYIARAKHNLFGYNAYDRDPVRYANAYATYAANIDDTARFIKDTYLTPGGRWWGGRPTLRSMQRFWSSSHRWGRT